MLKLEQNVFDGIIDLLLPYAESEASRRAMLIPYLLGHPDLLKQIDWSGAPHTFCVELVKKLWQHGEIEEGQQGLVMLLQALNPLVGGSDQERIVQLTTTINEAEEMPEGTGHWPDDEPASRGGLSTTTVTTDGGAFIGGNVSVGGNFTGRDSHSTTVQGDKFTGDKVAGDKFTGDKNVVHGTQNVVQGDQIGRDKVEGDSINVGNISGGTGIAIGRGAQSNVTTGVAGDEIKVLFGPLLDMVREQNSAAFPQAMELREEMQQSEPDDSKTATLIEKLVEQVPGAASKIATTFGSSLLGGLVGPITKYVLEKFE